MAKELRTKKYLTGKTVYAVLDRNTDGAVWSVSGSAYEDPTATHWNSGNYAITMAELSTTGIYRGDLPAGVGSAAGVYNVNFYLQAGGSPATTDALITTQLLDWSGTADVGTVALPLTAQPGASGGLPTVGTGAGQINPDGSGNVPLAPTQAIPTSNTANTVGDCLNAARAQGFGKWAIVGTTLTLYAADGTTAVRTFTLDSATAPTQRT